MKKTVTYEKVFKLYLQSHKTGIMRFFLILFISLFFFQHAYTQVTFPEKMPSDTLQPQNDSIPLISELKIKQDPRVSKMLKWHIEDNKKRDGMEGYRIEIFSSSALNGLEQALNKKVEFLKLYPENNVHVKFNAPVFKVRIGDFRTKNDALKLYKKIEKDYPGAFIVPDIIDFPALKNNNNERTD